MENLPRKFYLGKYIDLSVAKAAKLAVMLTLSEKWRTIFPNEKT